MSDVVMLGGRDHGKRFKLSGGYGHHLNIAEMPRSIWALDSFEQGMAALPDFTQRSLPIVDIKLGAGAARAVVYYKEVSQDVARLMLGDMVLAAWEKYELADTKIN